MNYKYERQILHIDMNAFFASCEQANNPELRKTPLIVGGDPDRRSGIVLAASYDAKRYGVKTTMTLHQAAKLCPDATFVKPSKGLYEKMSKQVMTIFYQYSPIVEQLSIDEAFLDMTGTERLFGDVIKVANTIQQKILKELELPCSVGISSNKLLAKMASDYKKPMGITTLYPHEIQEKLWPLHVGELYGVGKKSVIKLNSMGIKTIGDLANTPIDILNSHFGNSMSQMMIRHAKGEDDTLVTSEHDEVKSVGNELTYSRDLTDFYEICKELLFLSDKVGFRLRQKKLKGKTISIKVKFFDFKVVTRSKTIDEATDSTDLIYKISKELIIANHLTKPIRLLGITVSNFEEEEVKQLFLFEDKKDNCKLDKMVDEIRKKHGYNAVKRAAILDEKDMI